MDMKSKENPKNLAKYGRYEKSAILAHSIHTGRVFDKNNLKLLKTSCKIKIPKCKGIR